MKYSGAKNELMIYIRPALLILCKIKYTGINEIEDQTRTRLSLYFSNILCAKKKLDNDIQNSFFCLG